MRNIYFFLAALLSCASIELMATETFVNDIALPSKQYLMKGVKNEFYSQTFTKRWRPYNDFVCYGGDVKYSDGGRSAKGAIIDSPEDGSTLEITLINSDNFDTLASVKSTICAASPSIGAKPVKVQFLGDSFTRGLYFKYAFIESGYVPNVRLIGTRTMPDHPEYYHEGRGGWMLSTYFSKKFNSEYWNNPYFQPEGKYKYWGNTAFWRNAIRYQSDPTGSFNFRYQCGNNDSSKFGADGLLLNPQKNDLMYDSDKKCFVEWRAGAWKETEVSDDWSFDYGKYLAMWELESPEFLVVMLGLNDFRDQKLPLDLDTWNSRIEKLLSSYRAAVPDGRLVLTTPCTSCGTMDNEKGQFTVRQNALMWEHRRNIIEVFDNRENEGIYVVDASRAIDNENDYNTKDGLQTGNPHPYKGYADLGLSIAAFVQYYRDL